MKTKGRKLPGFIILLITLLVSSNPDASPADVQDTPANDIRILIDVSGSMKWNDPDNLRTPALRLLTGLLNKDTAAGVWTFGRYVNMLVPYGVVDSNWKKKANDAANEIHSKGLFTNIADTLDKSTWDWKEADENTERSIILLTDGLVDISKNANENQASRSRILDTILPRLKTAGATVHAIALSGEADEVLLKQLSVSTNGWYEKAETADNLERLFFRMFEKAAAPDTLPLTNNTMLVDESIEEMTLLVFSSKGEKPTQVVPPGEEAFGQSSLPDNVNWHHEDRYDLITIDAPKPGTWEIDTDADPDNRVMVVTNLRVVTTKLPNNISMDDEYDFFVRLSQEDSAVSNKEFLHFIEVDLTQQHSNGEQWQWNLLDNGMLDDAERDDGIYSASLHDSLIEGEHELTVYVDGKTFKRESRQKINVYSSPVMAMINASAEQNVFTLVITPRAGMVNPDTMEVSAKLTDQNGESQTITVPRSNASEWRYEFINLPPDMRYTVNIMINGEKENGKPFSSAADVLSIETVRTKPVKEPSETKPVVEEQIVQEPVSEQTIDINWILVSIIVFIFNILFAGGLFYGFRLWRKIPKSNINPWDGMAYE